MSISNTSPWRSCEPCSLLRRASSSAARKSSISLFFSLSLRSGAESARVSGQGWQERLPLKRGPVSPT
jgi:hypothetical protein